MQERIANSEKSAPSSANLYACGYAAEFFYLDKKQTHKKIKAKQL